MSPTPAIEARRLVKRFGATTAVDAISFAVKAGTVVGLLGGNGAGKTTTIGMIMGLTVPSAGEVRALGVDMARDRYRALGRMNFESPYVDMPHRLTVRQNLRAFGRLYGVAGRERRIEALGERAPTELIDLPIRATDGVTATHVRRVLFSGPARTRAPSVAAATRWIDETGANWAKASR